MQESRRKETEAELEKRKSEATSKETLEDLEESKKGISGEAGKSIPSPDGAPKPRSESADGSDTGGPM
jgi:hypothetical protein